MTANSTALIGQGTSEFFAAASNPPYPMLTDLVPLGSLATQVQPFRRMHQFWEGIRSGTCKVLFVGDSVTENVSQNQPMGHWTLEFQRELRRAFPWVTFTFINLSIGGRQAKHVMGYLNTQPTSTPGAEYLSVTSGENQATNFLRAAGSGGTQYQNPDTWSGAASGETQWGAGETWVSRLVRQNADLITLCFGLNEENGSTKAWFGQSLQAIIDCVRSGSTFSTFKRPSFVMLTPYNDSIARTTRNQLAEQLRSVAAANDVPVVDANRWDSMLVEGVDPIRRRWSGEPYLRYIRTSKTNGAIRRDAQNWWWYAVGFPTTSGSQGFVARTSTDTGVTALKLLRKRAARDFQIQIRGAAPSSGTATEGVLSIWYRVDPNDHTKGYEVRYTGSGTLELRYTNNAGNTTVLVSQSIRAFGALGESIAIKVRVEGCLHQVWTAFGNSAPATGGNPASYQRQIEFRHSFQASDASDDCRSFITRADGYGGIALGSTGTSYPVFAYTQFVQQTTWIEWGDPLPVKAYGYAASDLVGSVNDFIANIAPDDTNLDSPGGNTINHLKTDAYTAVYAAAIGAFMQQLRASRVDCEVIDTSAVAVSGTNTTSEEILATIPIPKNFLARNGTIEVDTQWTTSAANAKTFNFRLGTTGVASTSLASKAITTEPTFRLSLSTANRNDDATQASMLTFLGATSSTFSSDTTAIATSADLNLYITSLKATGTDTVTLERYTVRLIGGAA